MNAMTSKLPKVGETIFTTMSALATKHQAINLSQGFPDFDIDPLLLDCLCNAAKNYSQQYLPMMGLLQLREKIAEQWFQRYQIRIDYEQEITITSGGTEAIFDAVQAIVKPGDEVIILEPCYDSYVPAILLAGGVPISVPLTFPDYCIDFDLLEDSITPKTQAIMLNSPHNPTGTILSAHDIALLKKIANKHPNLFFISDEVYENIIFDGNMHYSLLHDEVLRQRSFVVFSFGKSLHVTGWKIGYCIAPPDLTCEFRKVHQYVTFSSATPLQHAINEYMAQNPFFYYEIASFYEQKRNTFLNYLEGSLWKPLPCKGTYFQLLDYSAITDMADVEFAKLLTKEFGVAAIPVSVFYQEPTDHKVLRFCFAKKEETLSHAAERLHKVRL